MFLLYLPCVKETQGKDHIIDIVNSHSLIGYNNSKIFSLRSAIH